MQQTEVKDHVLGKQVPFAVFIQNFRVYRQISFRELSHNLELRNEVKQKIKDIQKRHNEQMVIGIVSN